MKPDSRAAEGIAAILRSTHFIELSQAFRDLGEDGRQSCLTDSLLSISQSLRSHSARTREQARQIREHGKAIRELRRQNARPATPA